jgi:hypothetical protein
MKQLNIKDIVRHIEANIGVFHEKQIRILTKLNLDKALKGKNPYFFMLQNHASTVGQIIRGIVDAHISSNEETVFGDWLEGLAIFINEKVYGGRKSGIPNIDLEFDKDGTRYIITIKSGPNWGNSSQIAKMISDFKTAKKTLRTGNSQLMITAINGCCYGIDKNPDKGDYFKYCGQEFWSFISGNENLYTDIIEPLGNKARERNEEFQQLYDQMINRFTREFATTYCKDNGEIDWKKLVQFNSGMKER